MYTYEYVCGALSVRARAGNVLTLQRSQRRRRRFHFITSAQVDRNMALLAVCVCVCAKAFCIQSFKIASHGHKQATSEGKCATFGGGVVWGWCELDVRTTRFR